jgi:Cu/Ag efflux protein CusF
MRAALAILFLFMLATPALAAPQPVTTARIHGTITKIDPMRHTFWIHHAPFASMPMSMTMEVEPVRAADLGKLHRGEKVDLTVDTAIVPWPGTDIRPAK